ncbi:MAG: PEP-CTERM sorting domain-containing protein [Phycisphaerales bacterium]
MLKTTAAIAAVSLSSFAIAGTPIDHESSFLAFGAEMPFGDGNMNTNYAIARGADAFGSLEMGLKAKERFTGDLTTDGNGRYFANAGSPDNDGLSSWNIDFGYALSRDALPTNYEMTLMVDFDSGFGTQSWVTLDLTNFLLANAIVSPSGGGSQNPGFGFWAIDIPFILDASGYMAFDADALGEYDVKMILNDVTGAPLLESSIVVEVVPAPGAVALLGLGGLVATRRRRA